ncbi:MAG: peptidylprolyl isomerase [Hyphomonadaceae bacterium]|nr:peptidylprolyl isomerase [Hyphomonadaceae bacterium]
MKHTLIEMNSPPAGADAFAGCGHGPSPAARRGPSASPVFVNGVAIPESAIAQEAQNHAAASAEEAHAAAAHALVIRELLLQRASALGLTATPVSDEQGRQETDEEALVRQVLSIEAPPDAPSEPECKRVYAAEAARFSAPELYEASHILIAPAPAAAPDAWESARLRADAAVKALQRGEDFAALARALSNCPSAVQGGSLGQLQRGDLAPAIEDALMALHPGETAEAPVRTQHGWHVLRLDRIIPAQALPYEAVAPAIYARLMARAELAASARYITRLAAHAEIEGLSLAPGAHDAA